MGQLHQPVPVKTKYLIGKKSRQKVTNFEKKISHFLPTFSLPIFLMPTFFD